MNTDQVPDFRPGGTGVNAYGETYDALLSRLRSERDDQIRTRTECRVSAQAARDRKHWTDREWASHLWAEGYRTPFRSGRACGAVLRALPDGAVRDASRWAPIHGEHKALCEWAA